MKEDTRRNRLISLCVCKMIFIKKTYIKIINTFQSLVDPLVGEQILCYSQYRFNIVEVVTCKSIFATKIV